MNQSEYAAHRGISQQRIAKLIQQGKLKKAVTKKGRVYEIDPGKADRELERTLDPINRPKPKPKKGVKKKKPSPAEMEGTAKKGRTSGLDYSTARTLHEQYKAALCKLEYEEKSGKLILASEVAKDADHLGRLIKERLTAIPPRIAPVVAPLNDPFECEQIMKTEINQILEDISKEVTE